MEDNQNCAQVNWDLFICRRFRFVPHVLCLCFIGGKIMFCLIWSFCAWLSAPEQVIEWIGKTCLLDNASTLCFHWDIKPHSLAHSRHMYESFTGDQMRLTSTSVFICLLAPCRLLGCKNGPAPFPGRMSYKATKPGLVFVLYLSMFFIVLVFIRAPFYVLLVFIICVVCLLVVLVKLSLLAKLLARKTPLSSESSPLQFLALA